MPIFPIAENFLSKENLHMWGAFLRAIAIGIGKSITLGEYDRIKKETERPPPGRRWVRQSAESPTKSHATAKPADVGDPTPSGRGFLKPEHRLSGASTTAELHPTYWKWPPGRRGFLDPRNGQ